MALLSIALATVFFSAPLQINEINLQQSDLKEQLHHLCYCKKGERVNWNASFLPLSQESYSIRQRDLLNYLQPQILSSDDIELITLFKRGVRNHNTLHNQHVAKPIPCKTKVVMS